MKFGKTLLIVSAFIVVGIIVNAAQIELRSSGGALFPSEVNITTTAKAANFSCTDCIGKTQIEAAYFTGGAEGNLKMGNYDIYNATHINSTRATIKGKVVINQSTDTKGLIIDSAASTAGNYALDVATGSGAYAARFSPDSWGVASTSFATFGRINSDGTGSNWVWRDVVSGTTAAPVLTVEQENAGDDQPALSLIDDGTGVGSLKIAKTGTSGSGIWIDSDALTAINVTDGHIDLGGNDIYGVAQLNATSLYVTTIGQNTNLTSKNLTDVECIIFQSGGKLCTG